MSILYVWKFKSQNVKNRFCAFLVVKKFGKWGNVGNVILNNFYIWNFLSKHVPTRQEIKEFSGKCTDLRICVTFSNLKDFFNICVFFFFFFCLFYLFIYLWVKIRTFVQNFFDFPTSRNAFWAKVPKRRMYQIHH